MNSHCEHCLNLIVKNEAGTMELGQDICLSIAGGGIIHLRGDLGSGKTTLARSIIRNLSGDINLEVPSPSFSILQEYQIDHNPQISEVLHSDLYRLNDPNDVRELGIEPENSHSLIIVEWPENGGEALLDADLLVQFHDFDVEENTSRTVTISGSKRWMENLSRSLDIRKFLNENWGRKVMRKPLQGDASTRSYETVQLNGNSRILMNAPKQTDGPIIQDNKPYSQIANLAENVTAFVGIAKLLKSNDLMVPTIFSHDLDNGLLLISDLGREQIIDEKHRPIKDRYLASAEMLAQFHNRENVPNQFHIENDINYIIPEFDKPALLIEVSLLADWYAPRFKGKALSGSEFDQFNKIWNDLFILLKQSEKKIALRDFHSPNIIWQPDQESTKRVGVIDFQDAVLAPSAYDLASLGQDARVDVSVNLENEILHRYCNHRSNTDNFDEALFRRDYAIMAAQRATKILGIFVRLDERDGKPSYLKHLPRMQNYIRRSLKHPVMHEYKKWFETVIGL